MPIKKYGDRYINLNFVTSWFYKTYDDGWKGTLVSMLGTGVIAIEGDFTKEIERDMMAFMESSNKEK